jgi:hypothetical protein
MRLKYGFFIVALAAGLFSPTAFAQLSVTQSSAGLALSSRARMYLSTWYGRVRTDGETCNATSCPGPWLSTSGYTTPGHVSSSATATDFWGNVVATAAGHATSSSTWNGTRSPIVIDVNASVQANASSSAYGAEADTPQLKPLPIGDGLSTVVTVSSPQQSRMTVTGLVPTATGSTGTCGICSVSKAASWSITVQKANGQKTVYDFTNNGGTFTAVIPAGSKVTVSWQAEASAYAYGPVGFATATASVYGQVKFQ